MKSLWNDADARTAVEHWGEQHGEAVALRVYSSRLIGSDPDLVLHGGGNTSVKASCRDVLGEERQVLFVKGSGSSLDSLTPRDLPCLDLSALRALSALESLSDEQMVNQLRIHLFDARAPNPSVEALLHAFLPHRFVDHSHADAILALTNQPEGQAEKLVADCFGSRVVLLPYIMPGFPLALAVAAAVAQRPEVEGVVLAQHGLLSMGESAHESYERHIALVDRCEQFLSSRAGARSLPTPRVHFDAQPAGLAARAAPILRGLLAEPTEDEDRPRRLWVVDWRGGEAVRAFCASEQARSLAETGPLTPDHVIRTKSTPLFVEAPDWASEDGLREQLAKAVDDFRCRYDATFEANCRARKVEKTKLDSAPRVVLLPGAGAFCFGRNRREARIAGDITEHTLAAKLLANAVGEYNALSERDLFDMEYWSLEQAKLGGQTERPLERHVVLITGGAGAIGRGVGDVCAAAGAQIVLADLDGASAEAAAAELEERHGAGCAVGLAMDVTREESVRAGFDRACLEYGGVDVVVPNAGVALVAPIEELSAEAARRVLDVNYIGVLLTIKHAARVFRLQGTGGHIVVNSSKNVFAPGKDFGAYSASKAAAAQIAKVAAIELAPLSVRVNLINADAIFSEGDTPSGLWKTVGPERARSRGLRPDELPDFYRERNLLKARVCARHIGNAVVFFATNQTPTTGASLPIDGGVVEAFPR